MLKVNTLVIFVLVMAVLLMPLAAMPKAKHKTNKPAAAGYVEPPSSSMAEEFSENPLPAPQQVRLFNINTNKIETLPLFDYVYGVVCGECPMLYHEEAIKAQIIAAHTYTLYCIEANRSKKYDLTSQPETSQAYITKEQAFKNWGNNAEKYDKKLRELMNEVWNEVVIYNNKPILAAYHAISSGKTEAAESVWGKAVPYLISVNSEGDKLADKYKTTEKFALTDANEKLKPLNVTPKQLAEGKQTKTETGCVLTISCSEITLSGEEIRAAFNLRSANFDIKVSEKNLTFTVRGYGHGVGLSQNGANYMAKAGYTYRQILAHYYSGADIAIEQS